MSENEVYELLEDDLIRLNVAVQVLNWWQRLTRKPTPELRKAVEDIHKSIDRASAQIEHCKLADREKMIRLTRKSEKKLLTTIKKYKKLNRWNYVLSNIEELYKDV